MPFIAKMVIFVVYSDCREELPEMCKLYKFNKFYNQQPTTEKLILELLNESYPRVF